MEKCTKCGEPATVIEDDTYSEKPGGQKILHKIRLCSRHGRVNQEPGPAKPVVDASGKLVKGW